MINDDIYYLVHISSKPLHKARYLRSAGCNAADNKDQYPGVYFTLVTKQNIDKEDFFPGKYIFIFSRRLLEQANYHINIKDANGMINEHYTYYPWNIRKAMTKLWKYNMNEVVFHDNVSMDYCCKRIKKIPGKAVSTLLPHHPIENAMHPDMTKKPFYCFMSEDTYSGYPKPPKSSLRWFAMMAKVAGITKKYDDAKSYIRAIRRKSKHLCKHRDQQKLEILQNYKKYWLF
jgi:hypothetical protein